MQLLLVAQIIISVLLTIAVALQSSTGGLGGAFGSSSQYHTKRGVEKSLHYSTIVLAVLFTAISLISLTVS